MTSAGPFPLRHSIDSATSSAFPTVRPSGSSIAVITARQGLPMAFATVVRATASSLARAFSFMNAPRPNLTSRTRTSIPSESFLLRMLAQMSGMHSTVAVTSRSEYSLRSAGAISSVWVMSASPILDSCAAYSARVRPIRNPAIDSSLSTVPPVWPSPRPLTMGTMTPQAATIGARCSDTLSPTPPVECLSALGARIDDRSATTPDFIIASVRSAVSRGVIPRRKIAIRSALSW